MKAPARPVHALEALVQAMVAALDAELHPDHHDLDRVRTHTRRPPPDGGGDEQAEQ